MLKFLLIILFIIPICFLKKNYWIIQNFIFLVCIIFIFKINVSFFFINFSYFFSIDVISYGLIILRIWICGLIIISREIFFKFKIFEQYFLFLIIFLLFLLFLTFCSINLFLFYLFFERRLIPTFFLILGWGYQPDRLQAGIYLLFYTLLASLPLLIRIFYLWFLNFSLYFFLLKINYSALNFLFYISIIFAFLVKIPIFFVHLWLPKAHVEAPVAGSIILAGVLLKLGGYGLLRIFFFLKIFRNNINYWWIIIRLLGGCFISLTCLRQIDIKILIAYSSVVHIGIVLRGLLTLTSWGLIGSYILIIAHGLCSSGLFCLANFTYERLRSRRIIINKGLLNFLPRMSLWWFLLCAGNIAAPPTLNLLGEISLFNRIIFWSAYSIVFLSFISFFGAAYSLFIYSFTQQGKIYSALYSFSINFVREYLILFLHWFPLNILILKRDLCFLWL